MKLQNDNRNTPTYVFFDVDSKYAIKNTMAPCNLEIGYENTFLYLPSRGSILLRQKGRYGQTEFNDEIYTYEWLEINFHQNLEKRTKMNFGRICL